MLSAFVQAASDASEVLTNNAIVLDAGLPLLDVPGGLVANGTVLHVITRNIPATVTGDIDLRDPSGSLIATTGQVDHIAAFVSVNVSSAGLWKVTNVTGTMLTSFRVAFWTGGPYGGSRDRVTIYTDTAHFERDIKQGIQLWGQYTRKVGQVLLDGHAPDLSGITSSTCTPYAVAPLGDGVVRFVNARVDTSNVRGWVYSTGNLGQTEYITFILNAGDVLSGASARVTAWGVYDWQPTEKEIGAVSAQVLEPYPVLWGGAIETLVGGTPSDCSRITELGR